MYGKLTIYNEIAKIHIECINQGFLHTLGEDFLALLYEAIDADPNSALFVKQVEGKLVGFVAGGCGMQTIYRQMLNRWISLLMALLPALLNPVKLKQIIEIVLFSRKHKPVSDCPKAELFSIAVKDSFRGKGIAEELYQTLAQHFSNSGETAFCIVVGNNLDTAHRFYKRMGVDNMAQIMVHQGQSSTLYRQNL